MQPSRLPILALGLILIIACSTGAPPDPTPKHIRQSNRHLNRAAAHFLKGCYFKALAHYQQAHERYTAADQIVGIANSLNGIANVYYRLDELPSAIMAYDEAIDAYGLIESRPGMVGAMSNKAAALISAGRLDEAEVSLDRADQLAGEGGVKPALRHKTRAMLMMQRDSAKAAESLLQKAIVAAKNNEPDQLSSANYTFGRLLLAQQRPSQAIIYFNQSLALDREKGAYDDIAHDLAALGECHTQLTQGPQAVAHFKRSIKIFALLGNATKVQELANLLKLQTIEVNQSARSTLHWVTQWLEGRKEANLCR